MITRLQRDYADALIVHRLDLDTSGIMIVARGKYVQGRLSALFQRREVYKTYEALVAGTVADDRGSIELPIARDWENRPRQKICAQTGKSAQTLFEVIERRADSTRLRLHPITGRTHQLRIHCHESGHPILGCDLYAPNEELGSAPRLMLHATEIRFCHPLTGIELIGHSPAPF
jgi:tRNA pseudouridine32 synthase/23S rRNA pseudouridine746 synthase